jgi:hypothetical protein
VSSSITLARPRRRSSRERCRCAPAPRRAPELREASSIARASSPTRRSVAFVSSARRAMLLRRLRRAA